jgi:NodT family efflux transporter outer membrane factor (OMF) lipoprotein
MFKAKLALAALAALTLTTGCVPALVKTRAMEPDPHTPDRFPGPSAAAEPAAAPDANLGRRNWSDVFTSAPLRKLIDEALTQNQELNLQIQELIIAQNELAARRGEYLPKVRVGAGAGVDRVGVHTARGVSDESLGLPRDMGDFGFGLVGSWEVDIWGKLRNEAQAADFRYQAGVEGRNFIVTQIVAEIARSYYDLLALDSKLEVLNRNIAIQSRALEMVRIEKQAARVTELAVQRFEAEVAKNKSVRFELEQERTQVENRINFLLGRFPQPVARQVQELKAPVPAVIRAGVPSQLLENRPDVRQAERELEAAKLDVSAARARFFPALSIDAKVGFNAFNPAHLLNPGSIIYGLAGNLTAPVLNRAAIEAEYGSANARQLQAVIRYERTILQAFVDVANQVANLQNMQQGYEARSQQVGKLSKSVEMSTLLFRAARADYVEVLLTRRDLLEAEMELIERRKLLQQSVVNLYQALGGGWRTSPKPNQASGG